MAEKYGFFDGETLYGQDELLRYYDSSAVSRSPV